MPLFKSSKVLEKQIDDFLDTVAEGGLVYLETARQGTYFEPGAAWESVREKAVGDVFMRLLKKI